MISTNNVTMDAISHIDPNFFLVILLVPLVIPTILIIIYKYSLNYDFKNFYEILGFLVRYYLMISPLFFLGIAIIFPCYQEVQDLLKNPVLIIILFVVANGAIFTDYYKFKSEISINSEIKTLKSINQQLTNKYNIRDFFNDLKNICQSDLQYYYDYYKFFSINDGSMSVNLVKDKKLICVLQKFPHEIFKKYYQYNLKINEKSIISSENVEYTLASVQLIDITDKQAFFIIKTPETDDSLAIIDLIFKNDTKYLKKIKITMNEDLNLTNDGDIEKIKEILEKMKSIGRKM